MTRFFQRRNTQLGFFSFMALGAVYFTYAFATGASLTFLVTISGPAATAMSAAGVLSVSRSGLGRPSHDWFARSRWSR